MRLKDQRGYKRLAVLVSSASGLITFILLIIDEYDPDWGDVAGSSIVAVVVATVTFAVFRSIYWVIDGFKEEE